MPCSACQKRRKLLQAKLAAKKQKGKTVQAAAIGAVLGASQLVGKLIGEEQDGPHSREDAARGQAQVGDSEA